MLVDALSARDMNEITHGWSRLREMKLLTPGLVPFSYFHQHSEFISKDGFSKEQLRFDCDT